MVAANAVAQFAYLFQKAFFIFVVFLDTLSRVLFKATMKKFCIFSYSSSSDNNVDYNLKLNAAGEILQFIAGIVF